MKSLYCKLNTEIYVWCTNFEEKYVPTKTSSLVFNNTWFIIPMNVRELGIIENQIEITIQNRLV